MAVTVHKSVLSEYFQGYEKGSRVIYIKVDGIIEKRFCLAIDRGDTHWGFILHTSGIPLENKVKQINKNNEWFWTTFEYIQKGFLQLPSDYKFD